MPSAAWSLQPRQLSKKGLHRGNYSTQGRAHTVGGQAAAVEEHGAVEEADGQRQQQPRQVVRWRAPVGQPGTCARLKFHIVTQSRQKAASWKFYPMKTGM